MVSGVLEELKTSKNSSEIFWPLGYIFMKMTYSMQQQHALIKMNAIFKFACHKDVAQPKSLYISCAERVSLVEQTQLSPNHTGISSSFLVQTIYLHYLTAPRGARSVKRTGSQSWNVLPLIFSQNWMNCIKTFKFNKNCQNMPVFLWHFVFFQFWLNISGKTDHGCNS